MTLGREARIERKRKMMTTAERQIGTTNAKAKEKKAEIAIAVVAVVCVDIVRL